MDETTQGYPKKKKKGGKRAITGNGEQNKTHGEKYLQNNKHTNQLECFIPAESELHKKRIII